MKEPGHDQFGVTDHSATAPVLKRAISERVIHRIPAWVSPNALALTSGVLAAMAVASVWLFLGNMRAGTVAGKVWMIRTACCSSSMVSVISSMGCRHGLPIVPLHLVNSWITGSTRSSPMP